MSNNVADLRLRDVARIALHVAILPFTLYFRFAYFVFVAPVLYVGSCLLPEAIMNQLHRKQVGGGEEGGGATRGDLTTAAPPSCLTSASVENGDERHRDRERMRSRRSSKGDGTTRSRRHATNKLFSSSSSEHRLAERRSSVSKQVGEKPATQPNKQPRSDTSDVGLRSRRSSSHASKDPLQRLSRRSRSSSTGEKARRSKPCSSGEHTTSRLRGSSSSRRRGSSGFRITEDDMDAMLGLRPSDLVENNDTGTQVRGLNHLRHGASEESTAGDETHQLDARLRYMHVKNSSASTLASITTDSEGEHHVPILGGGPRSNQERKLSFVDPSQPQLHVDSLFLDHNEPMFRDACCSESSQTDGSQFVGAPGSGQQGSHRSRRASSLDAVPEEYDEEHRKVDEMVLLTIESSRTHNIIVKLYRTCIVVMLLFGYYLKDLEIMGKIGSMAAKSFFEVGYVSLLVLVVGFRNDFPFNLTVVLASWCFIAFSLGYMYAPGVLGELVIASG